MAASSGKKHENYVKHKTHCPKNPPSIPTLAVATLIWFFRNTRLVIDWHNFGYSILALKLGPAHPLVRMSRVYEAFFPRFATANFAVTNAMVRVLRDSFHVSAMPLHDRPAPIFQPLSNKQRKDFLSRLPETKKIYDDILHGEIKLIVSSTSWTQDEDFTILLDALVGYSNRAKGDQNLPKIMAIITGKGPQKQHYMSRIKTLTEENKLLHVQILTAWLSAEDYALLLGSAHLGISLHTSSSGVDLPMKVVDMFGTGLPVLGWSKFEAWPELVREGFNGLGFTSAEQLQDQLVELFGGDGNQLQHLRAGALKECTNRWDDEWDLVAGKVFQLVSR
jgi:beta-1,4-mannosyltransferase